MDEHEPNFDSPIAPRPKVVAAGIGGAIAAILAWLLAELTGTVMPPGVEAAFATVVAFVAGYWRAP